MFLLRYTVTVNIIEIIQTLHKMAKSAGMATLTNPQRGSRQAYVLVGTQGVTVSPMG